MGEANLQKLYRGVIIGLIVAVAPLLILGSVQIIVGLKVSGDNAKAIQKIQDNYMRIDLFERWVLLMEERAKTIKSECKGSKSDINKLEKEIDYIYDQMKIQAYGRTRSSDTINLSHNGIF